MPVVEIKSSGSAEGRTQLLYLITANALVQCKQDRGDNTDSITTVPDDGAAVWIDCSHRFDVYRLRHILTGHAIASQISACDSDQDAVRINALVSSALQNLHLFSPWTPAELLVAVRQLESYLLSLQGEKAGSLNVRAVIISDITSFYWEERQREEEEKAGLRVADRAPDLPVVRNTDHNNQQASAPTPALKRSPNFTILSHHSSLIASLSKVSRTFSCPIFVSTSSPFSLISSSEEPAPIEQPPHPTLRSPLPSPWARFVNVGIVLQKEQKNKRLWRDISLLEALDTQREWNEKQKRTGNRSEIQAWIDARKWVGACFSEVLEKEGMERLAKRSFKMMVGDAGVDIMSNG